MCVCVCVCVSSLFSYICTSAWRYMLGNGVDSNLK